MSVGVSSALALATWLQAPVEAAAGLPPWSPAGPEVAPASPAPPVAVAPAADRSGLAPAPRPRRFVFAFFPALTFGVSRLMIPSVSGSFFFGGRLRRERWALGVQATGSLGMADRYFLGVFAFRLHFTALHHFGARGVATVGAGVASLLWYPAVAEAEVKVGARLGARKRWLLGGLVRLGINFYYREQAPLPQVGLFTGMSFL